MITSLSANQADIVDEVSHYLRLSLVSAHHHLWGACIEALDVESELAIKVALQSFRHGTHAAGIKSHRVSTSLGGPIIVTSEHSTGISLVNSCGIRFALEHPLLRVLLLGPDGSVSLSITIRSDVEDLCVASCGVREHLLLLVINLADRACAEEVLGRLFLEDLDLRRATCPQRLLGSTHEDRLSSRRIRMPLVL